MAYSRGASQSARAFYRLNLEVIAGYGGRCVCCGETRAVFLTVDHLIGGGAQERKRLKGQRVITRLRQEQFPVGYQVLCYNCNIAKRDSVACPCPENPLTVDQALAAVPRVPNKGKPIQYR